MTLNIKTLIPCTNDTSPTQEVINSIINQGSEYEIIDCTMNESYPKYVRIAYAKEKLRKYAMRFINEFIVFNDKDIKNLYNDNFQKGIDFLIKNKNYGAIAFSRDYIKDANRLIYNRPSNHICNGVMVVRTSILNKMSFALTIPIKVPDCFSVGLSLQKAGYLYGYLDGIKRIEHIHI